MTSLSQQTQRWLAVVAVLLFFWLALTSLAGDSPTMDEQNHLSRGAAFAFTGDPRLSVEHPTLINGLSGLLLRTERELKLPFEHPSWERRPPDTFWYAFADEFMWTANRERIERIVFLGRLPIVLLTVLLGSLGWWLARRLWGGTAGLAALLLILFDPNILAHGRYITTDLGGATFIFLATLTLWWVWRHPRPRFWPHTVLLALVLGLAFTSKLLALGFVPIWSLLALLPLFRPRGEEGWPTAVGRLFQLWLAGFFSIFIVWGLFAFEWGPFLFLDESLRWLNAHSGPMPSFWSGIERILVISSGGRSTFLLQEFSNNGFWLFFPVAFVSKTPLLTQLLILLGLFWLMRRPTRRRLLLLLVPALAYFTISLTSALNIGFRHLLPMFPFLLVLAAGLWGKLPHLPSLWQRLRLWLLPGLLIPALWIYPHYLSYFNLAVGGPNNGHNILIDSSIDWGQDMIRLQSWMAENEVEEIKLAWFGTADPALYGIEYDPLPGLPRHFDLWWRPPLNSADPEPGIYVISASNLWELPREDKTVFPWFRAREPDEKIGYSIFIYRVE